MRACTAEAFEAILDFFAASNPFWLGDQAGADTRPYASYDEIKPIAMFDIDYDKHNMYHKHIRTMGEMNVNRRVQTAQNMITDDPALKDVLDVDACTRIGEFLKGLNENPFSQYESNLHVEQNEKYLFHGGTWDAIWSILQTGFDETKSYSGLFGAGCYFAEDPGKSDQYAVDNETYRPMDEIQRKHVQDHFGIHDNEYADAVVYNDKQDIFCMLMCRVVLGSAIHRSLQEFESNRTGGVKVQHGHKHGLQKGDDEPLFYGDDKKPMAYDPPKPSHPRDHPMRKAHNLNRVFNSIIGKHEIGSHSVNKFRYREFIVYKGIVAQPTQLIFYKRVNNKISPFHWTDPYGCP